MTILIKAGRRIGLAALVLVAIAPFAPPVRAQSGRSSSDSELLLSDSALVVTATKTAQRISDEPSAVTVIDEQTIRLSGATTIPDLLRLVPGVNVSEINGSEYNVGMRGFNQLESNTLLVMIDGRSVYRNFFGNVLWDTIPVLISQIKRIEIVRGPGSALYGANAFNGVINIITKSPLEELHPSAPTTIRVAAGQRGSLYSELAENGGKPGDWAMTVGAADNQTGGYMPPDTPRVDKDDYQVPIVTLDAQKTAGPGNWRLSATGQQGKVSYVDPGVIAQNDDWYSYVASLTYSQDHVRDPIMARFYTDTSQERFISAGAEDDRRSDFEIQQEIPVNGLHDVVYGGSYRFSQTKTDITGPNWLNETLWGLYAQDEYHVGSQTNLFAGVRLDSHSHYGSAVTPRVSLVHHLQGNQTLRVSYSTAFRTPTILDSNIHTTEPLFGPLTLTVLGNPNLQPEKIASFEVGYRKDFAAGDVGITMYDNWARDLIQFVPTQFAPSPPFPPGIQTVTQNENIGRAHVRGLEFESEYRLAAGVKAIFNYSYEDTRDARNRPLQLAPYSTANFAIQADLTNRFTGWLSIHSVSSSFAPSDTSNQNLPIGAYTQVDARVGHRFGPQDKPMYFSVGATDLFNDGHLEYPQQVIGGIPTAARIGRTLWVMIDGKL
jgi:iron complex outermembrane receptor protein